MVMLFPVPALVSKVLSGVQKQKMKATDARVQNVTESGLSFFIWITGSS